jgi:hypothetical protein
MGIRAANKPQLDNEGFAQAKVTSVAFGEGTTKGKDGDVEVYERLEIGLEMNGTLSPIKTKVYLGTTLNDATPDKKGELVYNRLTRLCLALGLVEKGELVDLSEDTAKRVEAGLQALEGQLVAFKLGAVPGRSLPVPILESFDTVQVVESK